jgi:hypothetical protein
MASSLSFLPAYHLLSRYRHDTARAWFIRLQKKAVRTAFKLVGYNRRVAKRKGFSDDPKVIIEHLDFAIEAINWSKERLYRHIFSDEVLAYRGAHTNGHSLQ